MNVDASSFAKRTSSRFHRITRSLLIAATAWSLSVVAPAGMAASIEEDGALMARPASILDDGGGYAGEMTASGLYRVTARFLDFNGEAHALGFDLPMDDSRRAFEEFGYSGVELDALREHCNASPSCDQAEMTRITLNYYRDHALRVTPKPGKPIRLTVDVAQVVSRNLERVQPVAEALKRLAAERGYDRQWMMQAAIALVQSGLPYRRPPASADGRSLLGFYPPAMALQRGYGDCDTKAALLAAILMNLGDTPIVGVHVPDHYLLGIAAKPRGEEAFITHEGRTYVLVEVAGPARRQPGEISEFTQTALKKQTGVRVDPMF